MKTDIAIVGGGLCGLALARALDAHGADYVLLEARDRIGGRILSTDPDGFDLGPAWFWDGQPRMARLVEEFGLGVFEQFSDGLLVFEDAQGRIQHGRGGSMAGSYRIEGGLGRLTHALAGGLNIRTGVRAVSFQDGPSVTITTADLTELRANKVVLCMPPRLATRIQFDPPLDREELQAAESIPTWMAGQAKAVAVFDRPFWREQGLSGDAMSYIGPMVEIHDASPAYGSVAAFFGFLGVPPQARRDEAALRADVVAQLVRLFGPEAATPSALHFKDWAFDPLTATDADHAPLRHHPQYGMPAALAHLWKDRILFSGSETAEQFGGYLEGALEAAERSLAQLGLS
ncbi:monoamine oxidase [Litoreibacter ponti]|uniref:Monoamine oxidase n=1 Tax=Litoreibacter ponti TaxID=1510457 RepID=A0A2T6BP90_9RHOB|nr:FAD-dependent oxidoreductase [Litoreibacter ponti]PTX57866.1 monoamine oxidase [Litoreibacter ponti]